MSKKRNEVDNETLTAGKPRQKRLFIASLTLQQNFQTAFATGALWLS